MEQSEAEWRLGGFSGPLSSFDFRAPVHLPARPFGAPLQDALALYRFEEDSIQIYEGTGWKTLPRGKGFVPAGFSEHFSTLMGAVDPRARKLTGMYSGWDRKQTAYIPLRSSDCAEAYVMREALYYDLYACQRHWRGKKCEMQSGCSGVADCAQCAQRWKTKWRCGKHGLPFESGIPFLIFAHARPPFDSGVALVYDMCQDPRVHPGPYGGIAGPPLVDRIPRAVWAGTVRSAQTDYRGTVVDDGRGEKRVLRSEFVERYAASALVDVFSPGDEGFSREKQCAYKFIVCLEGNDAGSSLYWVFGSGSVPLLPEVTYHTVWHYHIKPNVHYVPFTLDDIESTVERLLADPALCDRVVRNAKEVHALVTDNKRDARVCALMMASLAQGSQTFSDV